MLNKLHPFCSYKENSGKNLKKCLTHFDPHASGVRPCLTPFSQLQFGLIGCMILMKKYVSLKTAPMKMGKRNFYSDHSNGC